MSARKRREEWRRRGRGEEGRKAYLLLLLVDGDENIGGRRGVITLRCEGC